MENKMSSKPPLPKSAEAFIDAAEKKPALKQDRELPWLATGVRADVTRVINAHINEPYRLKLKFIADNSPYSQQRFIRETLEKAIDEKLKEMGY